MAARHVRVIIGGLLGGGIGLGASQLLGALTLHDQQWQPWAIVLAVCVLGYAALIAQSPLVRATRTRRAHR